MIQDLERIYRDDPDAGMHAAAEWTLRRYGRLPKWPAARYSPAESRGGARQWYVTPVGQTMAIIPGGARFAMGSSVDEVGRGDDEQLHMRQIARSFSIATKETTVEQFQQFLADNPQFQGERRPGQAQLSEAPQTGVTWYEAAAFCNWLSAQEGLGREEWCYLPNSDNEYGPGMRIADDFFARIGYRLPTEAEWEYACRAGATTAYYFGRDVDQLPAYAEFARDSGARPLQVAARKPNDFGLFDMHGNVAEWCHDRYQSDVSQAGPLLRERLQDLQLRSVRGGSFHDGWAELRSAARDRRVPTTRDPTIGFRVAKSY